MREKVLAEVTVVDSRDAALEVIRTSVPDVLLLSALLSPRDEDELIAHLRTLDAQHLQTHTIPQLASALTPGEGRSSGGLLSVFRRKKKAPEAAPGCDPDLFAEEIRTYLKRAEDKKRELQSAYHIAQDMRLGPHRPQGAPIAVSDAAPEETSGPSSWASPFEWKPSGASPAMAYLASTPEDAEPPAASILANPEPVFAPEAEAAHVESVHAGPETATRESLIPEPGIPKTTSLIANPESVIVTADDPEDVMVSRVEAAVPSRSDEVVVMREPSILMQQPVSVLVNEAADAMRAGEPEPVFAPIEREPAATISLEALDDDAFPEITLVEDPVDVEQRYAAPPAAIVDVAAETIINLDAETDDEPTPEAPRTDAGFTFLDSGVTDSGFALQDQGSGIRDRSVGPLASWARVEKAGGGDASPSDDLRMLLAGLAVPPAIAGVRYPRGCRIRRVRVPASQAADIADTTGPVILSRRALAQQREQSA